MRKTLIKTILRVLISITLMGFIMSKVEFPKIKDIISGFNPLYYLLAMCILAVHQFIWASMWRYTLREKHINISSKNIYRAVLTSYFFGTFLPSSAGPDLVLIFNIGKNLKDKQHAPGSFLFIRIINGTTILLVSGIALLFIANTFALKQILRITWTFLLCVWILYWIAVHPKSRIFAERIAQKYKLLHFIHKIFDSFSSFGKDNKTAVRIWLLGIAMTLLKVSIDYSIALALGIRIPYIYFLGLVPAVSFISMLPISIAGLGVREGAYVGIFSNLGVPSVNSFSISLAVFTLNIWLCIIGGLFYIIHGSQIKSKAHEI